jgi:TRAP transporter 4TM/12TM fusion protein
VVNPGRSLPPSAPKGAVDVTFLVSALGIALTVVAAMYAAELHLKVGLYLFAEQALALILGFCLAVIFLSRSARHGSPRETPPVYDLVLAGLGLTVGGYLAIRYPILAEQFFYRPVETFAVGIVLVPLIFEALRRTAGWTLVVLLAVFMLYALYGDIVPGTLQGRPMPFGKLIPYLAIDKVALFGLPLYICCIVVVLFILMGQLLYISGGSAWFTDLAAALMGRTRGGAAKIAVVASALFGSISGNAVSNVVSTGMVTIPLMKQAGFEPKKAAAFEAVASTGGQITPPVMGAAGFLMAEFLLIPYSEVVLAAIVPALLYFIAVFVQADLEAARKHIAPVPEDQIPTLRQALKDGWHFPIPFVLLVMALFYWNRTPEEAALWAAGAIVVLCATVPYKGNRMGMTDVIQAVKRTGVASINIVIIGAMAGLIIGMIDVSGIGFGLTFMLVQIGEGHFAALLGLTALICIIVGMGMPTAALYILVATLVAPPMIKVGVDPLAAHLFVFYFGLLSHLTPPVALAAYAAANLAGSRPLETAIAGMIIAWPAFLVPFLFVLSPELILKGSAFDVVVTVITAALGIWFTTAGSLGYFVRPLGVVSGAGLMVAGVALLIPPTAVPGGWYLQIGGAVLAGIMVGRQVFARRRERTNGVA